VKKKKKNREEEARMFGIKKVKKVVRKSEKKKFVL
jgi:hypothetical protein